tara:strand:- start:17105 stop:17440 length:336 start_codon:yes stop_codon:yes gene_type:complete
MSDEMRSLKSIVKSHRTGMTAQTLVIAVGFGLVVDALNDEGGKADPDDSAAVSVSSKANARGYYYLAEYAALMGLSESTITRRRDAGRLDPPAYYDNKGRIAIPLGSVITE